MTEPLRVSPILLEELWHQAGELAEIIKTLTFLNESPAARSNALLEALRNLETGALWLGAATEIVEAKAS